MIWLNSLLRAALKKLLQSLVAEAANHRDIVTRYVSGFNNVAPFTL